MKIITIKALAVFICFGLVTSCADLEVENLNDPDLERVLNTPEDYQGLISGGFNRWWRGSHANRLPFAHFDAWADNMTTTNEYQLYYSMGTVEPRRRIDNNSSSDGFQSMSIPWSHLNSAISNANDVINYVELQGNELIMDGENKTIKMLSMAYLLRGLSRGYLANFFGQALIIDATDIGEGLDEIPLQPYNEVLDAALDDIDQAIEFAESTSFTTFDFLSDVSMNDQQLIQFANAQAAKFIISNGRSSDEYTEDDWQQVVDYASNAYHEDLVIQGTGSPADGWRHEYQRQSGLDWYWKSDMRIINLMDPDYPARYPVSAAEDAVAIPEAQSEDARLEMDFTYDPFNLHRFVTGRGPQLQSVYYYTRYEDLYLDEGHGDIYVFRKENIDMMLAEAYVHLNRTSDAIDLINSGSRVNRGGLDPVPNNATDEEVLNAIYYEVEIDLQRTWAGYQFFLNRRRDMLQPGTPLHLPVPATELDILGEPIYTFGGVSFVDEDGTADGTNAWNDYWEPGYYEDWYQEAMEED